MIPRIIVKSDYMKGKKHKEYYVNYIATREGVDKYKSDNENKNPTTKQKELIEQMLQDFPKSKDMFEYEDYMHNPTRSRASEFISAVVDQNINALSTRENYVDYISHRPRVEKLGEHGLFTDAGISFRLQDVVKEIGEYQGNVWTHIISIKREDAQRLGYDHVESWMSLCQSHRNQIAEAMKIDSSNLKWYAAFHNEGHHPHIHMVVYSTDPKEGYLTQKGIEKIRHMFASEIFQNDLLHLYKNQTQKRDEIKKYSKDRVRSILNHMNSKPIDNSIIFHKIIDLKKSLENYHGRLMYAYIPQNSKQIIHDILREMEKDPHLKELYDQWMNYKKDIHGSYSDNPIEKLPLLEQKEFRSLKNMILKEVMTFDKNQFLFDEVIEQKNDFVLFNENEDIRTLQAGIYLDENNYENIPSAIRWLEDSDSELAHYLLGKEYHQGMHIDKDLEKAIYHLTQCQDNEYAYYRVAQIYDEKNEIEQEIKYLKQASDKNYDPALIRLSKLLIEGIKTEKNINQAIEYLKIADSHNNQFAQYMLGKLFLFGVDVQQDKDLAREYLMKSSTQGNIYAQYLLEHMDDFYNQSLALVTSRFFHHVSHIIENELNVSNHIFHGEHKLRMKIRNKRSALGHKEDDQTLRF